MAIVTMFELAALAIPYDGDRSRYCRTFAIPYDDDPYNTVFTV